MWNANDAADGFFFGGADGTGGVLEDIVLKSVVQTRVRERPMDHQKGRVSGCNTNTQPNLPHHVPRHTSTVRIINCTISSLLTSQRLS